MRSSECLCLLIFSLISFFFSSRRRHTRSLRDWSSDVCSSDLGERITSYAASGLGATDLQDAYELDTSVDPSATIAIIDAYGYSSLESDLSHYRSQYGLPACTTASGCLKIVNQSGQTSPLPNDPPSNDDWTTETALDVDMASAACPKCKLIVVQADDDQGDGLMIANNTAASLHATVISNSWGGPENSF